MNATASRRADPASDFATTTGTGNAAKIAITVDGLAQIWRRTAAVASVATRVCRLPTGLPACIDLAHAMTLRPIEVDEAEFDRVLGVAAYTPNGANPVRLAKEQRLYATARAAHDEIAARCRPGRRPGHAKPAATVAYEASRAENMRLQIAANEAATKAAQLKTADAARDMIEMAAFAVRASLRPLAGDIERAVAGKVPADVAECIGRDVAALVERAEHTMRDALAAYIAGD